MRFLLCCPRCHHRMLYETRDPILTGKRKQCVYCPHSFKVRDHIIRREQ